MPQSVFVLIMCISVSYTTNTSARLSFFEDKRSGLDSLLLGCMVVQYTSVDMNEPAFAPGPSYVLSRYLLK